MLIEHFAGNFPFWLAPVQAIVLPLSEHYVDYARSVYDTLRAEGFRMELDDRNEKVGYKIREAELQKIPFMLIVGEKEQAAGGAAMRAHGEGDRGLKTMGDILAEFRELNDLEKVAESGRVAAAVRAGAANAAE